ncbi:lipopolysaccharide biosynthesis protein [Tunturiibacter gelidoferens]|uniref:O-antigen/teichoic acid export membrane protein n=2 Tax=Tunturiibacter TaxID=3154218 RepID=A0A7Y9T1L8_9BACT|nr:lipopolysaccharide biosynthesis protein [Edaphobacter lichenicola]MBB5340513.1 O-antigen/teichoic acid export membrane protein [Edaphobacter lichenicola]NYF50172.1 O-antigen/teichoic acid export membrane protein [Edaphobacter lichenicola]
MSMDISTKRRLMLGFLTNWVGKLSSTVIQFVQIPVFLHFWSVPLYGEWMIVNSIPAYLSFSNVGFGSVAGNEMTMLVARDDRAAALRVFQSCWWLIAIICTATIVLLSGTLYYLPASRLLKLTTLSEADTKWIIFYLGVSVLLGQLEQLLQSAYRAIGRYPYGTFLKNMFSLFAFGCMIAAVTLGAGARTTALVFASVNVAITIFFCILVRRDIPWIEYGWQHASFAEIRKLARPAFAYMGFPLGNALSLQGSLLAVGYALGPTDVVIFSTARTVSRVALQMVQMVNNTFEPEMSIAFGAGNYELTRTLLRRACQLALLVALILVIVMLSFGPWFLVHWTGGHVPPSRPLLSILLAVVVLYALWSTSGTLMTSTNQHQRLATYYILGTSVACVLCYVLARAYGLYGAAASLLISEIVMNLYVVPACLRIAHDTLPAFLASMLHYPSSLRPTSLLARIRRSKPGFES